MILESAEFYSKYYASTSYYFLSPGLWAAALCEIFMIILSAARIYRPEKQNSTHWMNYFIKSILVLLFIITVAAASLNVVQEKIIHINNNKNNLEIIHLLKEQRQNTKDTFDVFVNQHQRVNTALSFREQKKINDDLRLALKQQKSNFSLWSEVIILFLLRFSVQLANVVSVWIASWLYRLEKQEKAIIKPVTKKDKIQNSNIECEPVFELPRNENVIDIKKRVEPESLSKVISTNEKSNNQKKTVPKEIIKQNIVPPSENTGNNLDEVRLYQNKIKNILSSKNSSTSIQEICRVADIKFSFLQKILSKNQNLLQSSELENVKETLQKLEALMQQTAVEFCM